MTAVAGPPAPAAPPAARGLTARAAGTAILLRLALRRDRVMIPVWVAVIATTVVSVPQALDSVYATAADRADLARQMTSNGSMRALYGPVFGDSLGALTAWRSGAFAGVLAAIAGILVVVRHTREEEESGRQEMLSSGIVGRRAPLTAALLAAVVAVAAVAAVVTAGLAPYGLAGALALGLAIAGTGAVFAATAAVTAQITGSARLARGMASALLGGAFALRAAGDASAADGSSPLTWASPIGWAEHVRPYATERWWVLGLFVLAVAALTALAYALAARRDLGRGFLPERLGPAEGRLSGPGALAWRIQRGAVAGWCAAMLVAGAAFGSMADGAADLIGDNERTREILERMGGRAALIDTFLASMAGLFGMVTGLFIVASVLRLGGEETSHRAEPILAHPVGRLRWAGGHLAVAFGGSAVVMLAAGLGLAAGHGRDPGPILLASLVQIPAVWTLGGLAVLLYGAASRGAVLSWSAAGLVLLVGWIGPALNLPRAVMNLSPFTHLPKLPGADVTWTPMLLLCAVAAALVTAGLAGLRRRDITG